MNFSTRLHNFMDQWIVSLRQYPITHVLLIILTILSIITIKLDSTHVSFDVLQRIIVVGFTALPLTIIRPRHWITQGAIIVAALGYYFVLPLSFENMVYAQGVWVAGTIVLSWLLPSLILAYHHRDSQDHTWNEFTHWRSSLAQGLIAGGILRGGIAASFASIEFLFNVYIDSDIYAQTGTISMIAIAGWIWLINLIQPISTSLVKEGLGEVYPRWMYIFGQYIFLPLCIIYGCILIAYGIKIISTGNRPEGQLIYMVTGYVIFGLLTWFALLPTERIHAWVHAMYRILFGSFVLTSGLMIGALILRLQQYGLTIDRYIVGALITWIIVMGLGCVIWFRRRWLIGLGSFALILALTIYTGPLSATGSTYRYRINQIQTYLPTASTNTGDATQLYRSIDYLARHYQTGRVTQILTHDQVSQLSGYSKRELASHIMTTLNITGYDTTYQYMSDYVSFYASIQNLNVAGYNQLLQFDSYRSDNQQMIVQLINHNTLRISTTGIITEYDLTSDLSQLFARPLRKDQTPYIISQPNFQIIITNLNGEKQADGYRLDGISGYLLIK